VSNPRQVFSNAVALHRAGSLDEAAKLYEQVLAQAPNQVDCLHLLGTLAIQRRDFKTAVKLISRAIKQKKEAPVAEFHNNIGAAYKGLGQIKDAAHHFRLAARLKPEYAEAFNNLGTVQEAEGALDKAKENFETALSLKPDYAKPMSGLGNIAAAEGNLDDAEKFYERALALDLNNVEARSNLSQVLIDLGRTSDAEAQLRQALSINPNFAPAHYNLGVTLEARGDMDGAQNAYRKALSLDADEPDYHWNAALVALLKGDFDDGWEHYEWRLRRTRKLTRDVKRPRWDGSDPGGQTILVQTEQGYGDTFQFIRYAQLLKERGAKVIVECQPKTERLLPFAHGVDEIISRDEKLPKCDRYIQLLSLSHLFSTTLENVPAGTPYISAPPELTKKWGERAIAAAGYKVGLVWRGNPQNTINPKKSIPIDDVAGLCALEGINWFSIQLDAGQDELGVLRACAPIEECGPQLTDWAETAALISMLDLVITVDTGVAHLAGALGKPVWILLSHIPDWRWMLERADSPWYPTARLYRQPAPGDWLAVLSQIRANLEEKVHAT
jgi:Flp pilus assembly protein TadD